MSEKATNRRVATGKVVSNKMDKSIVVLVVRQVKHPRYGKYIKLSSKMHAHDEDNTCNIGDIVRIEESKPLSKTKTWRLVEVVERSAEANV